MRFGLAGTEQKRTIAGSEDVFTAAAIALIWPGRAKVLGAVFAGVIDADFEHFGIVETITPCVDEHGATRPEFRDSGAIPFVE